MGDFVASLRARTRQDREAEQAAAEAGDDYRVQVHAADLANLARLAAEHGVRLTPATGQAASANGERAR
ncbi:hypothetical protein F0L68_40340 [Solihabitans fulvus]|uniref:Uncharacterized protein n=1 Tax=Solihabitans fulvus TaxID=1892852 RepID=A0A5B2W5M1_9PSEU|nr:hypothetical protein [Solihabitans fulvus]KAA2247283.1 hypothetical protein F0L68_40340 [Solihabitans fulvus]